MAVSMRLEFQVTKPSGGDYPTVGDLREWLAAADARGAKDSEELLPAYDHRDDLEGFFIYVAP